MRPILGLIAAVLFGGCAGAVLRSDGITKERKMKTKTTVNQLSLEFSVVTPRVKKAEDLEVRAIFTNESKTTLRLKTLFLDFGVILLKVRKSDGTPVLLGPAPLPPADDGETGRVDLSPGQSIEYVYRGINIFGGQKLPPGEYQIRFRYANEYAPEGEWKGTIETEWLTFRIADSRR